MDVADRLHGAVGLALQRNWPQRKKLALIVAVSGGPDSLALLHSLVHWKNALGLALHVAHLNHDFRGQEAEEDARFVGAVAKDLGLPATVERRDVLAYQKERRISSFEAAARELRYDFLATVARDNGADAIALGHTADDQAETVLMHILRGSGLHGLVGMREVTPWRRLEGDGTTLLFRPLLAVTRGEILAYCQEKRVSFRQDSGNLSLRFARNRVRHRLLPALKAYNPRVRESLLRLARSAAQGLDYLDGESARRWQEVAREEDDSIALDTAYLATVHPFMQGVLMRRAYQRLTGDVRRLEERHLIQMVAMVKAPPGRSISLPLGLTLRAEHGRLVLGKGVLDSCPFPTLEMEYALKAPGVTEGPGWRLTAELVRPTPIGASQDVFTALVDAAEVDALLRMRARRPGDRFQPLGMGLDKKLQDFFVDAKVPRAWRDRVPLVIGDGGIVWVVGYRISERARVSPTTRQVLKLRWQARN